MQELTDHEFARRQMIAAADAALPFVAEESAKLIQDQHRQMAIDVDAVKASGLSACGRAIRIGEELVRVKDGVGHGNFVAWIEANCPFTRQMAATYMRFANDKRVLHLTEDLTLRAGMTQLGMIPSRPHDGGNTYRGGGIPSVYDPLNKLTAFLGAVDSSGAAQEWETDPYERSAVQRQYKPKLEEFILRLFGVKVELPATEA